MATEKKTKRTLKLSADYERVSEFFRVSNGAQIDIHYRGQREGEPLREITAHSRVPEREVEDLLAALNSQGRSKMSSDDVTASCSNEFCLDGWVDEEVGSQDGRTSYVHQVPCEVCRAHCGDEDGE